MKTSQLEDKLKYLAAFTLLVILTKTAIFPLDWPTTIALAATLAAFIMGRAQELKVGRNFDDKLFALRLELEAKICNLEEDLLVSSKVHSELEARIKSLEAISTETHKLAEDSKKLISSANLGMAFRPPTRRNQSQT